MSPPYVVLCCFIGFGTFGIEILFRGPLSSAQSPFRWPWPGSQQHRHQRLQFVFLLTCALADGVQLHFLFLLRSQVFFSFRHSTPQASMKPNMIQHVKRCQMYKKQGGHCGPLFSISEARVLICSRALENDTPWRKRFTSADPVFPSAAIMLPSGITTIPRDENSLIPMVQAQPHGRPQLPCEAWQHQESCWYPEIYKKQGAQSSLQAAHIKRSQAPIFHPNHFQLGRASHLTQHPNPPPQSPCSNRRSHPCLLTAAEDVSYLFATQHVLPPGSP